MAEGKTVLGQNGIGKSGVEKIVQAK